MSFQVNKKDGYTLISVSADKLDSNIAPSLKSELVLINSDGVKNIIIDLSAARYCDSSGLSAILVANRLCKNSQGTFVLTGLQDAVKKLIAISQLDTILNIASNVEEGADMVSNQK
ncbi:MAG: STAS domain-containing protein [Bacteroidia bacterium]